MTIEALIFMLVAWSIVITVTAYCIFKVLKTDGKSEEN